MRTVNNLLTLRWPLSFWKLMVIADNCTDDTAALARAAGAQVIEREDASLRGKGYALKFAYDQVIAEGWADAVVVVDADSETTSNLLEAFAARLEAGALAVQAFYGVLNPNTSWRTRLSTIALAMFHRLRSRARERMGVSAGLRGNGMCFAVPLLTRVPHQAFSIVEDLEYAVQLSRAAVRVHYADEAEALGEMVSNSTAAASQRRRWEGGRGQIVRQYGLPLLVESLRQRSGLLLDMAMDVLVPPLASVGIGLVALSLVTGIGLALDMVNSFGAIPVVLGWIFLLSYILRGVALSGLGTAGWLTLARAPLYVMWKVGLRVKKRARPGEWIRTEREPPPAIDRKKSP